MSRALELVLLIMVFISSGCADNLIEEDIIGKWVYSGVLDQSVDVECPDLFHIKNNGRYIVLNDCYGLDSGFPVVEKGRWDFNGDGSKLVLSHRVFNSNYSFGKKGELLVIYVKKISENELHLYFDGEGMEIYRRR